MGEWAKWWRLLLVFQSHIAYYGNSRQMNPCTSRTSSFLPIVCAVTPLFSISSWARALTELYEPSSSPTFLAWFELGPTNYSLSRARAAESSLFAGCSPTCHGVGEPIGRFLRYFCTSLSKNTPPSLYISTDLGSLSVSLPSFFRFSSLFFLQVPWGILGGCWWLFVAAWWTLCGRFSWLVVRTDGCFSAVGVGIRTLAWFAAA